MLRLCPHPVIAGCVGHDCSSPPVETVAVAIAAMTVLVMAAAAMMTVVTVAIARPASRGG